MYICTYVLVMTMSRLSIEIPEDLHRQLKAQASLRGLSMREYVMRRLKAVGSPDGNKPRRRFSQSGLASIWAERDDREMRAHGSALTGRQPDEPPAPGSMLELLENRPWHGTMTKAEIDAYVAEERAGWDVDV